MGRAAIHRDGFAKHVAVAELEARRLAPLFLVLRRIAQRGELINLVVGADAGRAVDHDMRPNPGTRADPHLSTDDAEGPDRDIRRNLRLRCDHRAWVDHVIGHPSAPLGLRGFAATLVSGATMISADATSAPSTSAT